MNHVLIAAMLLAAPPNGGPGLPPPNGGPGFEDGCFRKSGPCLEAHSGRGCRWPDCCEIVCEFVPECCDELWDDFCAVAASKLCSPPADCVQDAGGCFEVSAFPGCNIESCCRTVCSVDQYCCDFGWDAMCVAAAAAYCDRPGCDVDGAGASIIEPDECEEPLNDGCEMPVEIGPAYTPIACGDLISGTTMAYFRRDVDWFEFTSQTRSTRLNVTVSSEFPAEIVVIEGTCEGGFAGVAVTYVDECRSTTLDVTVGAGTVYIVVAAGRPDGAIFNGIYCRDDVPRFPQEFGNGYVLRVDCVE